jgi:hypothetical protein
MVVGIVVYEVVMKLEPFNDCTRSLIVSTSQLGNAPVANMKKGHDPSVPFGYALALVVAFATGVPPTVTPVLVKLAPALGFAFPLPAGVDVEAGVEFPDAGVAAPLVTELADDAALPVAVVVVDRVVPVPEAVELPPPTPLPPLVVVVAAPDPESVVEGWVPLAEVAVALTVAVAFEALLVDVAAVVVVAFPLAPPAG